ncbi:MAG TPA: maleylpyruvate isomerase N-terminal domain-containing protein [Pseudonocardiaceae bacterium]|nr:maleylpyruvate isomerase N-terminal domain-containing protein [Pseudonocardiaceae bacterium]
MGIRENYESAARAFAALVRRLPDDGWEAPGLGVWDRRALVGHTVAAALTTVSTNVDRPAEPVAVHSPEGYYAQARSVDRSIYQAAVEAGTAGAGEAGEALGADPAATVDRLVDEAIAKLAAADDDDVLETAAGGMRLSCYLPTRTFELAVHSLDLAGGAGVPARLPDAVLAEAAVLGARIAVAVGDGALVLRALTGRAALPDGFSVLC